MANDPIWAPWRLVYVQGGASAPERRPEDLLPGADPGCFMCHAAAAADGRRHWVVHRGRHVMVMLNRYPYNNGHLLVCPLGHLARPDLLGDEMHLELARTTTRMIGVLEKTIHPDGFNVGLNLGRVAGAGLPGHLHWHVVPRWNGDTNFMPTVAAVHVIPQALEALWELLVAELHAQEAAPRAGELKAMVLIVLRLIFLIVSTGLAVAMTRSGLFVGQSEWVPWAVFGGTLALALAIIAADALARRKDLATITSVYFGLLVGFFLTYVLGLALNPLPLGDRARDAVQILGGAALCYVCISLLLQTKDDFRFIIPYVEFSKEVKGRRPYVLDTSVIIDGRIADVVDTRILDAELIVPRFVIGELQSIADSSDRLRRVRGRRGLDILNKLRTNPEVDLSIFDRELPEFAGQPVDLRLVLLAKHLSGKLITNDYNLNKVARLHGVGVLNLNDLANALKPVFLPGEQLEVRVVKPGEDSGQGVGYLDDGTMVVVESGREHLGQTVGISVTSVLQTSAGRMIFGRFERRV